MTNSRLEPRYAISRALIIGINDYQHTSPLGYAVNDAEAIAKILQERFSFLPENVHLLLDREATHTAILQCYLSFASDGTDINDRVLIFFAGHGYTTHSRRGEVGFLVPYDGDLQDLSSLIRWDELTRNADLIAAKHMLFVMDACYGGLAITRALQPGSMRFLKDMLLRYSRQVVTAGKADEIVADTSGPLPGHSIFTGHLLEALSGKSADGEGLITANGIMAYVYRQVGHDPYSHQTPHFGYLYGDGDFIFAAPVLTQLQSKDEEDQDLLVSVPAVPTEETHQEQMTLVDQLRESLSDPHHRIRLHDLVAQSTREALSLISDDRFSVQGSWSAEEFIDRLAGYETATLDLRAIETLVAYWGNSDHREILALPVRRLSNRLDPVSGLSVWIALRWYPVLLLTYSSGIAAVASDKYDNLYALLHTDVTNSSYSSNRTILIHALLSGVSDILDAFKVIPGYENKYVPCSEYLFKFLQPLFDDLLFLVT
jgi:uncharacterized caspase-like protein